MAIDPTSLAASTGLIGGGSTTPAAAGGTAATATQATGAFGLSRDDFFKLFLAQLQHQDPTKPMDDQQMIAELAQFSMIDTLHAVEKSLAGQQLSQGSSLIGKKVQGLATDGQPLLGVVGSVHQDPTKGLILIVGSRSIAPDSVTLVSAAASSSASNPASTVRPTTPAA